MIATFNWDPFLWQAASRNYKMAKPPHLLFLHGNVAVGSCSRDNNKGPVGARCTECGHPFARPKLLFLVSKKDYSSDPYISSEWGTLKDVLKYAYIFTIFGYSAPRSDVEAVELMKTGWGKIGERNLEEIEIIDIKSKGELALTWKEFIHSHYYRTVRSLYESWIARHPRRTCDAMRSQLMDVQFLSDNWIPRDAEFEQLWEWCESLINAEGDAV